MEKTDLKCRKLEKEAYLTKILWGLVIILLLCVFYLFIMNYNSSVKARNESSSENHPFQNDVFNYLTVGTRNYMPVNKDHEYFYIESPFTALQDVPMNEDVIALQNVQILNENWKNPKGGSLEKFGPTVGFGRIMIMKSGYERKRDNRNYQHSFGLSISVNIGLNITEHGSFDVVLGNGEYVGAVYVLGTINEEKVMFCGLVGDYYYRTVPNTSKLLKDIFKKGDGRKTVVAGTFYSTTYAEIEGFKKEFSFEMEKGPLWIDHIEGYSGADHILVKNCNIVKQPTVTFTGFHRGWMMNAVVDVKKDFLSNYNLKFQGS